MNTLTNKGQTIRCTEATHRLSALISQLNNGMFVRHRHARPDSTNGLKASNGGMKAHFVDF
jgi:hypothetical protein